MNILSGRNFDQNHANRKAITKIFAYGILLAFLVFYLTLFQQTISITFAATTWNVVIRLPLNFRSIIFAASTIHTTTTTTTTIPTGASGNIQIYPGWNLISFPYADSVGLAGTCDPSILNFYSYDATSGSWISNSAGPSSGKGAWVYSNTSCVLQYSGYVNIPSISLTQGWNEMGTFSVNRTISSLGGTCVLAGLIPLNYTTQTSSWKTTTVLITGSGYWVQVPSSCTLT